MYAALFAAPWRDIQGVSPEELVIALIAPGPMVVRPRHCEPSPGTLPVVVAGGWEVRPWRSGEQTPIGALQVWSMARVAEGEVDRLLQWRL